MSFRTIIAAIATMGLATAVFALDETTTTQSTDTTTTQQVADNTAPDATTTTKTTETTTTTTAEKVNVNTASAKELMKVKGLNSSKAKAIVSYRKKHGEFKTLDDLKEVKGFKKMDDEAIKNIQEQLSLS